MVYSSSSLDTFRMMIKSVFTIAKPEKIAPATKYGGKIVVCHPGITEVAKSKDTMVCTESTSGVAKPAKTRDTSSKRCQSFARPLQPKAKKTVNLFLKRSYCSITNHCKSGKSPVHQKTSDTDKIGRNCKYIPQQRRVKVYPKRSK